MTVPSWPHRPSPHLPAPPLVCPQSLPFTCGPAALLSVLTSMGHPIGPDPSAAEIALWREVTAVACPGAHPLGLALAAERRGLRARLTWEGPRPWLWSHIRRTHHALLRKSDYVRIEASWLADSRRSGILDSSRQHPCEGIGLLLMGVNGPKGSYRSDPHWVGLWEAPRGVYLLNPLRRSPQPCSESPADLWNRSGFEGTRCWISLAPARAPGVRPTPGRHHELGGPGDRPHTLKKRRGPAARPEP
jgi:hypothetical protein